MHSLRQPLRQKRRNICASERIILSKKLLNQVQKNIAFKTGQKVAIYLPNDGEINPKYIQNFLKLLKISVYLPILVGKSLKFAKIGYRFKKNKFGILEPISTPILNANQMNIIFMPLVGFDSNKNRIGMGGGFYDRTLAFKKNQQKFQQPKLYGLAFDCQQVEKLEQQDWDVPLDAIFTPTKIY
jgi:5-formyltetrahydrofolate cyclo-ligase